MFEIEKDWGIERGYRLKPGLHKLAPILVQWIAYIEKYCLFMPDDSPYWHLEWTSVSTFAAAVWAAGGVASQEVSMLEKENPVSNPPRADLFFEFGNESYIVEAKNAFNQTNGLGVEKVYDTDEFETVCGDALEQIKAHINKCKSPIKGRCINQFNKLTMIFFAPGFVVDKEMTEEKIKQTLSKYRDQIYADGEFDLLCWCFPRLDQADPLTDFKNKLQYPGVILAAKLIS